MSYAIANRARPLASALCCASALATKPLLRVDAQSGIGFLVYGSLLITPAALIAGFAPSVRDSIRIGGFGYAGVLAGVLLVTWSPRAALGFALIELVPTIVVAAVLAGLTRFVRTLAS